MAHLLMMFQKFKLLRERNMEQLNMTRATSKLSRIEKNIKNKQKYYTSLFTDLENKAKEMKQTLQNQLRYSWGFDMNSYSGYGTMNSAFLANQTLGYMTNGLKIGQDENGKDIIKKVASLTENKARQQGMYIECSSNYGRFKEDSTFTQEEQDFYKQCFYQAQQDQGVAQNMMSQQSQLIDNNVTSWLEAAKEQLEAEQDSVIDALTYEQTMMELDKEYSEQRLQRINSEIESYDQVISESVKDVPKFGLG